jgi:hypothetical protein
VTNKSLEKPGIFCDNAKERSNACKTHQDLNVNAQESAFARADGKLFIVQQVKQSTGSIVTSSNSNFVLSGAIFTHAVRATFTLFYFKFFDLIVVTVAFLCDRKSSTSTVEHSSPLFRSSHMPTPILSRTL